MPNIGQNIARHMCSGKTTLGILYLAVISKSQGMPNAGKCQSKDLVYRAKGTLRNSVNTESHTGLAENSFKSRYE